MEFRFISFRTYGSGVVQYDSKAFMSDDMGALANSLCQEVGILRACGHDHIVVHSTCSAEIFKEWDITLYRV